MSELSSSSHAMIVEKIRDTYADVRLIYLFGSRAQQNNKVASDWDIAILPSAKIDNLERWQLAQELALALNQDVDLIDLLNASTVLQKQVIDIGVLLYGEEAESDAFVMQILSMYQRLQEGRKDIVSDFLTEVKRSDQ